MAGLLRARGVLSQADLGILVVYCDAFSRLVAARAELAREGLIVSTEVGAAKLNPAATAAAVAARELRTAAAELGATPTARARVPAAEPRPSDALDEFLSSRSAPE
jgi:P27 family predicted phage terminase small subunit